MLICQEAGKGSLAFKLVSLSQKGAKGDVIEHPVKFSNAENRRRFADMGAQHCPRAVDALAMIVPATVKKVSVKVGIWRQEKRAAGFWIQFEQVSPRAR